MKRYCELNLVELVEVNVAGRHGDMVIDPVTRRQNLRNLEMSFARLLEEYEPTYRRFKGQACRVSRDVVNEWLEYVDHLKSLMEKLKEAIA